jgi:dTDP-4-amino-4,6-dideoxygalactose transaminase
VIPLFKVLMSPDAPARVKETLESGYIGQGKKCEEFEAALEEAYGQRVLMTNSCTSAIDLALHLCGVGQGDEVITTPVTCTATNTHIVLRGARPVWADVDPVTGLIDPKDVEREVTRRTRAIIAVDFGGRSCDYLGLRKVARKFAVYLIQDAAHRGPLPIGEDDRIGTHTVWSYQAIKFLTTGDGGGLSVIKDHFDRAKLLRWFGLDRDKSESFRCSQDIEEAGYKYQSNDIAASIGLANLERAKQAVLIHQANAKFYCEAFKSLSMAARGFLQVPSFDPTCHYWLFPVLVEGGRQQEFIAHMAKNDIAASPVHARNDKHTAFNFPNGPLPGVDEFCSREVCIPVGWWLTEKDRDQIVQAVGDWR